MWAIRSRETLSPDVAGCCWTRGKPAIKVRGQQQGVSHLSHSSNPHTNCVSPYIQEHLMYSIGLHFNLSCHISLEQTLRTGSFQFSICLLKGPSLFPCHYPFFLPFHNLVPQRGRYRSATLFPLFPHLNAAHFECAGQQSEAGPLSHAAPSCMNVQVWCELSLNFDFPRPIPTPQPYHYKPSPSIAGGATGTEAKRGL